MQRESVNNQGMASNTKTSKRDTRPLKIGISARLLHKVPSEMGFRNKTLQYLEQSFAHWIMEHGALAFMVPAIAEDSHRVARHLSVAEFVSELDGLVLQGGADVAPETYGQTPIDPRWGGDPVRDRYELALLHAVLLQGKPVVGVCRGCQLLNVAFGGTLYQDIQTQRPEAQRHVNLDLYDDYEHEISLKHGSSLSELYPHTPRMAVTSIHHQAIDKVGQHVEVEAVSTGDGIVEAIRWTGKGYARGLQWHPEFHHRKDTLMDGSPIMMEFLQVAREAALARLKDRDCADRRIPRAPLRLASDEALEDEFDEDFEAVQEDPEMAEAAAVHNKTASSG